MVGRVTDETDDRLMRTHISHAAPVANGIAHIDLNMLQLKGQFIISLFFAIDINSR